MFFAFVFKEKERERVCVCHFCQCDFILLKDEKKIWNVGKNPAGINEVLSSEFNLPQ